ncbi:MAG: electron transfer flavoprotein subunit beta/FixA family protein [Sporichthyaceae bacterium]|nr:electron transfer flavoprotein subunit beta/FixA family protein [Sporichthyaceae bacterium]
MKIAVCVKYVPDAAADRSFSADHTTDRVGSIGILSELDEYAVEEALKIREAGDAEVIVLTMGPDGAETALKKALQMGADRAVHVSDPGLHGADAPATSLVLANAISRLEVDLVLCGMASTDAIMGVVPAMIAERLGLPQVTLAAELTVDGGAVRIRRDGEDAVEEIEASLPAVVSVTDQINEPRYPSFKGIMAAKKKTVETWSLSDLDVVPDQVGLGAAWSAVTEVTRRPPRSKGTVVTDDGTGAAQLADFLAANRFV